MEDRIFKIFFKKNYAVALGSCYLFKKIVEHETECDTDSAYRVCMSLETP